MGLCVLLVLLPLAVIMASVQQIDSEIWAHLREYQLPQLLWNTVYLVVGVGVSVAVLGTSTAWLTALYEFPLRRFFFWALMLPLAMPAYVMAFAQIGWLDYSGPVSTFLREQWGFAQGLPEIRSTWGVVAVMSLALYPYVYLLARNAFVSMGRRSLEVGASFGLSPWQAFVKVALPMARPWIAAGTILALMETLADFGTVAIFNYDTFTTAIYQAWFGFYSLDTAKQLASLLVLGVFVLLVLEQLSRGQKRFTQAGKAQNQTRRRLSGSLAWLACAYCGLVLGLAFVMPLLRLLAWAHSTWDSQLNQVLWQHTAHSVGLALMSAVVITLVALLLALAKRQDRSRAATVLTRVATLGYTIPGTVLAVGVFVPVAWLDNQLLGWFDWPEGTMAVLKGSVAVMLLAYAIRFLAVAFSSCEAGLERISPHQEEAARSLGVTGWRLLASVHLPLLKGALGTAMLMVFVDVMKEMPITLMMRPFGWETLSVRIFNFTTEGQYDLAAWPSLAIVLAGLIPVWLFSKTEQTA